MKVPLPTSQRTLSADGLPQTVNKLRAFVWAGCALTRS